MLLYPLLRLLLFPIENDILHICLLSAVPLVDDGGLARLRGLRPLSSEVAALALVELSHFVHARMERLVVLRKASALEKVESFHLMHFVRGWMAMESYVLYC